MNKSANVIYLPNVQPEGLDYAAYERRAVRRYRRASVCQIVTTIAEAAASLAIGLGVLMSLCVFLQIV